MTRESAVRRLLGELHARADTPMSMSGAEQNYQRVSDFSEGVRFAARELGEALEKDSKPREAMTRLKVHYEAGGARYERQVDVADDEEYWFESSSGGTLQLLVGKKDAAPPFPGSYTLETELGRIDRARPRLHIFNLVLVEVVQ